MPPRVDADPFPGGRANSIGTLKLYILWSLLVAHVLISLFAVTPGYLSIDEAIYHISAKNLATTGTLEIWTGYREFPSRELVQRFVRISQGRPVSPYPDIFTLLCVPFYWLWGLRGLFLLNALAFFGAVGLCYAITSKLFRKRDLSIDACLIFVLATYAWEYSQAAWPHTTATLFVLGSFYPAMCSYFSTTKRAAVLYAGGAGIVAGLAPGIRIDAALIYPSLFLPFLFARPTRLAEIASLTACVVPGLMVLSVMNHTKFGTFHPLSYGTAISGYRPSVPMDLVVFSVVILATAWLLTRPRWGQWTLSHRGKLLVALGAIAAGLLMIPSIRLSAQKMFFDAYMILVDMRILEKDTWYPAMSRSAGGGVIYLGALKKSLLQSMPYLTLLVVPLVSVVKNEENASRLIMLFLFPITLLVFFSKFRMEFGGLCLNYRYFVPGLPFVAILTAYALRSLKDEWGFPFSVPGTFIVGLFTVVLYFALTSWSLPTENVSGFAFLSLPLLLAVSLLILVATGFLVGETRGRVIRTIAWGVIVSAMVWTSLVAFLQDFPRHRYQRARNYAVGMHFFPVIPQDSIVFVAAHVDPFMMLLEKPKVRLAIPCNDEFKDFSRLALFHLRRGNRAFVVIPAIPGYELEKVLRASYRVTHVSSYRGFSLVEIFLKSPKEGVPAEEPKSGPAH